MQACCLDLWNFLLIVSSRVLRENCKKLRCVGGVSSRKVLGNVQIIQMSVIQTFSFPACEEVQFAFAPRHSSNSAKLQSHWCARDAVKFFIM
jgi:hypothetical protein